MARELLSEADPETTIAAMLKYTFADELDPSNYNELRDAKPQIQGKTRLFIARGKKDGMTKRKLVQFIEKTAGVNQRKIDDAQVLDTYSFITVPFKEAEQILKHFKKENKGKRPVVEMAAGKNVKKRSRHRH